MIQVMPPISTDGLTTDDVSKLAEDTRQKMLAVFEVVSKETAELTAKANEATA